MNPTNCHKLEGPKGMMPTCHDVALRIARGDVNTLPIHKRMMFYLHLSMCKACGPFEKQIKTLTKAFQSRWGKSADPALVQKLKDKLKAEFLR